MRQFRNWGSSSIEWLADELPDARDARVVLDLEERAVGLVELCELRQALVGVLVHGAELVHGERLILKTDALLPQISEVQAKLP